LVRLNICAPKYLPSPGSWRLYFEASSAKKDIYSFEISYTGISPNAPQAGAPFGEPGQHHVLGSSDGVEVAPDQHLDVGISFDNGAENLSPTRLSFNIAPRTSRGCSPCLKVGMKVESKVTVID
jgi:hypothetical protein